MPNGRETAPLGLRTFSAGEGAADATKKMLKRPTATLPPALPPSLDVAAPLLGALQVEGGRDDSSWLA
jgi:hypothetical protein